MISGIGGSGGMPDFSRIQAQMQQKSVQAFSKADGDGSGGLNIDEFKSMVESSPMAKAGGANKASEAFGKLDADGDGSLTKTELDDGMKKMMEKMSTQMFAQFNQGGGESSKTQSSNDTRKQLEALLQALEKGSQEDAQSSKYASVSLRA